jgi:hypothetical protein
MMTCSLVDRKQNFGGTCCLHLQDRKLSHAGKNNIDIVHLISQKITILNVQGFKCWTLSYNRRCKESKLLIIFFRWQLDQVNARH